MQTSCISYFSVEVYLAGHMIFFQICICVKLAVDYSKIRDSTTIVNLLCTMLEYDRGSYPISHWVGVEQREREKEREKERERERLL